MNQLPIFFQTKDFVGIPVLIVATGMATALLLLFPRLRAAAFFAMVAGAVLTEKLDLDIYSAYWYRGTTRGFEVTFIDVIAVALLVSTLLLPQHDGKRCYWPAGFAPLLLFTLYCLGSVACSRPWIFGLYELSRLVRGIVFFLATAFYVRRERELSVLVLALSCAVLLQGLASVRQRYLEGIYRVTGSLDHPNSLSMYLCLVTPVLVAAARSGLSEAVRWCSWLAAGTAAITVMLTLSRAGIPSFALAAGGAAALCVSWRLTFRKITVAAVIALGLTVVVWKSWDLLLARFEQSSLEEEYSDDNNEGRGYYLRQAAEILDERSFGVGLNNWSYWVSRKYGAKLGMHYEDYNDISFPPPNDLLPMYRYAAPAHNLAALTAGELGWAGLALFTGLWLRWFQVGSGFLRSRRSEAWHRLGLGIFFGCVGVFLQSLTEWTFRQTQIFLTFHMLVGVLASLHDQRQQPEGVPEEEAAPAADCPEGAPLPEPAEI